MGKKIVLVVGATGLVGAEFVKNLQRDQQIDEVRCIVRTPCNALLNSKVNYHVVSFFDLDQSKELFEGVTHVVCCVGTTIKKAKTREQFQMVDHFIPKTVARLAKDHGVESYQIISSLGASSSSKSFYLYVKGVVEETLDRFGFKRLVIYRPSLLEGNRQEFRFGEIIMSWLFRTFSFVIPDKYSPTNVESLARLMVSDLHQTEPGIHIVESTMIN